MTAPIDIEKLRQLAEAATPGPWEVSDDDMFSPIEVTSDGPGRDICCLDTYDHRPDERANDAAFIAAANPQTVLALLDEIERLRDLAGQVPDLLADAAVRFSAVFAAKDEACNIACDIAGSMPKLSELNRKRLQRISELGKVGR
jgi:hypothetical protein